MPALVSTPGLIISSAPWSRQHCLHNQSSLHSRQSEANHRANQPATLCLPGSSFSTTALQTGDERRSHGNIVSRLPLEAMRVDIDLNNAEEQEIVNSPRSKQRNVDSQQFAYVMDRRIFLSAFTSYLPSISCFGLTSATPAIAIPQKNAGKKSPFDEQRLLEQNKRMQQLNSAPPDFPAFIREGFEVKVVTNNSYVKCDSGLIYLDIQEGHGDYPKDGQQIIFHYIGFNESGRRVDSTYQQGQPARTRIGINAMIPGFEEGIRTMKPGGKRRIVVPPELGPPVGPSTFFSAKQFEVFDVELLGAKDCTRRTIGFYSDVVCD